MRLPGEWSKGMRVLAAVFTLTVGLTSFNGISALAGGMKNNEVKKEYKTEDIGDSLLELGKKAVRVDENTYDVTLSVKDKSFKHDKKMPLSNTDVVFVVDTSSSMNEGGAWEQLKEVLGDGNKGLVYNILGGDNKDSNNSVTFVGYNGNLLSFSNPDYYISNKFKSSDINEAVAEYVDYNKMSGKISDNTAGSNMTAGFRGAGKVFDYLSGKDRKKIAVLITDGDPSVGYTTLSTPYTLYSDTDKIPGYDWESYTKKVWCKYYKDAGNGKYIFSQDAQSKPGDDLIEGWRNYEYSPKWRKIIKERKTKHVNNESILKEAELLKKRTSNNKIYTVKVKDTPSELLKHGLFKDYYDGRNTEVGNKIYENIYNDVVKEKTSKFTYKAALIKIVDGLSDYVNWDNDEVVAKIDDETIASSDYKINFRYDNDSRRLIWDIPNGIPEGTTINLTYRVKLSDEAVIPGKGRDEDYKYGVKGLVNTDENTGDHAKKFAYPVSKENQSYVNYGVKEVARDAKDGKNLKGKYIDNKFPVAGVRPDQKTFTLNVYDIYGEEPSDLTPREDFTDKKVNYGDEEEIFPEAKGRYTIKYITINDKLLSEDPYAVPLTVKIEGDTVVKFYYEAIAPAPANISVTHYYGGNDSQSDNFMRNYGSKMDIEPKLSYNNKKYKIKKVTVDGSDRNYDSNGNVSVTFGTDRKVVFTYDEDTEVIKVYDHFNNEEGIERKDADIIVNKDADIVKKIPKRLEDSKIKDGKGHWEIVKKGSGIDEKDYEIKTSENGDREVHFYYLQKAKLHVTHHYGEGNDYKEDEQEALFLENKQVALKANKDFSFNKAEIKNGNDGTYEALNLVEDKTLTEKFVINNENVYVDLYYDYNPVEVMHTIEHIFVGDSSKYIKVTVQAQTGNAYEYIALDEPGWKLSDDSVPSYKGIVKAGEIDLFTFIYVKDLVNITINDNFVDENEQPVQGVDKAGNPYDKDRKYQGLRGSSYTPEALEVDEKVWDILIAEARILKADEESFTFTYKKKSKTIKISDKYGTTDSAIRSASKAAIDATFEVEPLLKDNWIVDRVIVNGSEKSLVDGRLKVEGYNDEEIVFIYKDNSQPKPEIKPEPQKPSSPTVPIPESQEPSNPVVPTPEPQTPSDTTLPAPESPVVDITEDTTPQGAANTDVAPSDDTDTVDDEDTGIEEIDDDITPQGEARNDKVATEEPVEVEEDAIPQGNATLPKTGGTNADVVGLLGLGLVGLGALFRKKTR